MINDVLSIDYSEEYSAELTFFGLELIKSFDISNRTEFLDSASLIFQWLKDKQINDPVNRTNELQIIRRRQIFSETENEELLQIRSNAEKENNTNLLCGVSILLENKTDVKMYLSKLSDEDQETFRNYPIFSLGKILGVIEID